MIIPDARADVRFQDNPLVLGQLTNVFYAGFSFRNNEGLSSGTICIFDHKLKILSSAQVNSLKVLSEQTMKLLEL